MKNEVISFPPRQSKRRLLSRVRRLAKDTRNINWSIHALDRMDERAITSRQALETIRRGAIDGDPETDEYVESKFTLKRRYAGRIVRVVVAVSECDEMTIITAM